MAFRAVAAYCFVALFLVGLAGFFYFSTNNVADSDSLYHIRHAALYAKNGFLFSVFPWVTQSVIGNLNADLWYGFHLALAPFTFFPDLVKDISVAGIVFTATALFVFFLTLKKFGAPAPLLLTLLFFFSTPDVNYRFTMLRPHVMTFGLAVLVFFFIVRGKTLATFIASAFLSFFHLALGWLPSLILLCVAPFASIFRKRFEWREFVPAVAGTLVGALARPHPVNGFKLAFIQIFGLFSAKRAGIPLRFASELAPPDWSLYTHEIIPVALIFLVPAIFLLIRLVILGRFAKLAPPAKTGIIGALALSCVFGVITMVLAVRSLDLWTGFSLIFLGLVGKEYFVMKPYSPWTGKLTYAAFVFILIGLAWHTLWFATQYRIDAPPPETLQASAEWLETHTRPRDIVYNLHWDNFAPLFFWNQHNYYINGMDPIFEYAKSPEFSWKSLFLEIDGVAIKNKRAYTCAARTCADNTLEDVYDALKNDFHASYVVVEPKRNPKMYAYFLIDPRYEKMFAVDEKEAVFRLR